MAENTRLKILNSEYESFETSPMRTFHNGHIGDSHEQLVFIRNEDAAKWYTNIELSPELVGVYNDATSFTTTGWGIKLMYGKRRPTEEEWDILKTGSTILLPDIGSIEAADTFTNHPVWVRVFCPGGTAATIVENMQLNLKYLVREVDE